MFYIVVSEKGGAERRETFDKAAITVGRVQENDLTLAKGNVSKRHCRIEFADGRFVVTDEDSTNGTYVNRRRIAAPTIVREGDRIYVGDFVLRIETSNPVVAPEERSAPAAPAPPVPPLVRPAPIERDWDAELARTTAPADSVRPPLGPPPAKQARRPELTSAFPVVTGDLLAAQSAGSAAPERAAARSLIEEVWRRLEPRVLEHPLDGETSERIGRLLHEQVQQLALLGHSIPPAAAEQASALAHSELLGLGPLDLLLDDPRVSEVLVSGNKRLQVTRDGVQQNSNAFCHPEAVDWAVARLCRQSAAELADGEVLVRRHLRASGFRLEAARKPLAGGGAFLRLSRPELTLVELDDLVHVGTLSRTMATFLRHCLLARMNVLVVGRPNSGHQELLGALAALSTPPVAWLSWSEGSLRPPPQFECQTVALDGHTDPALAFDLLLRMGQRVITSNPSTSGVRQLVGAVSCGLDGLVVAQEGWSIESTLLSWSQHLATAEVRASDVSKGLSHSFDIAIEVARLGDGRSRVLRICELRTKDAAPRDVFDFVVERTASGGSIEGHFRGVGEPGALLTALRIRGVVIDESLFLRPPSA